jgi:hypothetical protein
MICFQIIQALVQLPPVSCSSTVIPCFPRMYVQQRGYLLFVFMSVGEVANIYGNLLEKR